MKKLTLSTLVAALAVAAIGAVFLAPAQDAEAHIAIDPKDQLYLCYGAGLMIDKDWDYSFELGWNEHAGSNLTTCNAVLASMISQAQSNGWNWANPSCYTFTSNQPCRVSVRY